MTPKNTSNSKPKELIVVGDDACRAYILQHPCPPPSYPSGEQDYVDVSLRQWTKSAKIHPTDQNHLCQYRYNRYVHCSGAVPPAAQTSPDNWCQPPRAYPPNLVPLTFRNGNDIDDEIEGARSRVSKIATEYELDWRTRAEREEFLRQTRKARRSPHGLPPRKAIKRLRELNDIRGNVDHEPVPILKTSNLPEPPPELLVYWNDLLERFGLPEEVDFYPPSFSENGSDGRERSPEDEICERQFDAINFDGNCETTGVRPHDHQSRSEWQKRWQALFNPSNKDWKDATPADFRGVIEDPDFPRELARMQVMFNGLTIQELAGQLSTTPNALTKSLSRNKDLPSQLERMIAGIDDSKADSRFGVVVHMNGRNELKILGTSDDPTSKLHLALKKEHAKSRKAALKLARRNARRKKWDATKWQAEEEAAIKRIDQAYAPINAMLSGLMG